MAHLVFVEISRFGIQALEHAVRLGHRITRLTSGKFDWLLRAEDQAALAALPCETVRIADSQDPGAIEAGLSEVVARGPVDAVLTVVHYCVAPTSLAAERLGLRATASRAVANARDKARCRALLVEHGIPSVKFAVVRDGDEARLRAREIGYPVIVKPQTGMGKVLTAIVRDEGELNSHFAQVAQRRQGLERGIQVELTDEFLLEQIAVGTLYSLELAATADGSLAPLAIVQRKTGLHNPVLEMGSTVPSDLGDAEYDAAAGYAITVARALGLDLGFFHIEFIMTADGPRLVEVNPRIAGGAIPDLVRAATGVNLFELLVRVYAGESLPMRKLPTVAATSHTFLAAFDDCEVPTDIPPAWFDTFRPRIVSGHADIKPGQHLRKMDGNYDVYGVVRVSAPSHDEAVARCEELRREIEATLRVKLVEVRS
jgi:biotin carboxylase